MAARPEDARKPAALQGLLMADHERSGRHLRGTGKERQR
jgi:hypothetical protein